MDKNLKEKDNSKAIQPWGRAPTPLIPKSVLNLYSYLDAPQTIKKILGNHATLAELDGDIWSIADSVSGDCLAEIVDILKPRFNKFKHLRIYSDEQVPQFLETLPFSIRTKNAIRAYPEKFSQPQLRFNDVISVPAVGVRSAIEFACVVESAAENSTQFEFGPNKVAYFDTEESPEFSRITSFFKVVSAWALGEQKLASLASALPSPQPEWPQEIKNIWTELENITTEKLAGDALNHYSVPKLITQELGSMDERLLDIAKERIFVVKDSATLEELGSKFNVTRERVRQLEQKTLSKLERFKSDEYLPVLRRAESLCGRLGSAVQENHSVVKDALNWVVEDFDEKHSDKQLVKSLLFWLAGPYQVHQNWLLDDKELPTKTINALLECRDQQGLIDRNNIYEILNNLRIHEENHLLWLEHLGKFLQVEDGLIYFQGSILDKAYSILQYFARPMTVERILDYIGSGSVRGVRQRLIDDPRFWRINKQNEFVLAGTEGYDEYTGITDEIIQELELCGGQAPYSHLVEKLSRIYGVKENSVVAYLSTPMFIKDQNSIVRIRDDEDDINIVTDITRSSACYLLDRGTWCWRTKIDKDAVRGSGRLIPNAFAQQLGCDIGNKVEVPTELGEITLSWPLTSTTGAYVGSLRQALDYYGATIGDYLFIKATEPNVTFSLLKQDQLDAVDFNLVKLALLFGNIGCTTENEAVSVIAAALDITQTSKEATLIEARQKLISRGETGLSQFIQKPKLSVDDYINDMVRLFK